MVKVRRKLKRKVTKKQFLIKFILVLAFCVSIVFLLTRLMELQGQLPLWILGLIVIFMITLVYLLLSTNK